MSIAVLQIMLVKKELLDDILMYQYDAELKTNSKRYAML